MIPYAAGGDETFKVVFLKLGCVINFFRVYEMKSWERRKKKVNINGGKGGQSKNEEQLYCIP